MVIVEDASNNYDASTLRTVSIEYNRILQNTPEYTNNILKTAKNGGEIKYPDPNM
jgi:hypothetical protein